MWKAVYSDGTLAGEKRDWKKTLVIGNTRTGYVLKKDDGSGKFFDFPFIESTQVILRVLSKHKLLSFKDKQLFMSFGIDLEEPEMKCLWPG